MNLRFLKTGAVKVVFYLGTSGNLFPYFYMFITELSDILYKHFACNAVKHFVSLVKIGLGKVIPF